MPQNLPVSIPPVEPTVLASIAFPNIEAVSHIDDYDESMFRFSQLVGKAIAGLDQLDAGSVAPRCLMVFEVLYSHGDRLDAEGVLPKREDGFSVTKSLLRAVANAPLRIRMFAGSRMKLLYDINDVVSLSKKYASTATVRIASAEPGVRDAVAPADVGTMLGSLLDMAPGLGLPKDASLGEIMASMSADIPFSYDVDDFPEYRAMIDRRKAALSSMPAADAAVYEADPLPDSDPAVRMAASMLDGMPVELTKAAGIGPWSRYPRLGEAPGWNFKQYLEVVTKSERHASIPCRQGAFPVFYAAQHGTLAEFRRVVELAPGTLDERVGFANPLLVELASRTDDEKFALAVEAGADIQATTMLGHSAMFAALSCGNYNAVQVLLEHDYDFGEDPLVDRGLVARFLETSNCPPEVRASLHFATESLPERSELGQQMDSLSEMLASKMKRPRPG